MKNYICINNQKVELTDEQTEQIRASFGLPAIQLKDLKPCDTFKIGDHEFIVLEHCGEDTAVIRKDLLSEKMAFGKNNNYNGSDVDTRCSAFAVEIACIIGEDNVLLHTVDLTSDDGLKDYGIVERFASLLTADRYRRYVEILDKFPIKACWWLATAYSTPRHDDAAWIKCVSPSGDISDDTYDCGHGVRPFCILKSSIFVSK